MGRLTTISSGTWSYGRRATTRHTRTAQLGAERRRLDHLVDFVAEGRVSPGVRERLAQTEQKVSVLEAQIAELNRNPREFRLPSLAWVEARCLQLGPLLQERTMRSALLLRELLGPITLTPVVPVAGRPSYVARTKFDTLKLLENLDPDGGPDPGATSIGWWTRHDSVRTLALTPIVADLRHVAEPPRYQAIAPQVVKLRGLGYPDTLIAACTGVTPRTVAKAIRWFKNR